MLEIVIVIGVIVGLYALAEFFGWVIHDKKGGDVLWFFALVIVWGLVLNGAVYGIYFLSTQSDDDSEPDVIWWQDEDHGTGGYRYTSYVNCTGTQPQPGDTEWPLR